MAANFAADFIEPGLREPEYGRKLALLKTQLRQLPQRPLLLLLGSSRTAYGVRPDRLFDAATAETPLVYNFGILGGGPLYELLYFQRLLAAGIRPRWVVIEVHPALLKTAPELMGAHIPPIERCDARDLWLLRDYLDAPLASGRDWLGYRAAACYRLRGELLRRVMPHWLPAPAVSDTSALDQTTPSGWVPGAWPRPDAAMRQARAKLVRQIYAPGYRDFEVSDRPNRALRQILALCRQEGIVAALLLMPEAEELRDAEVTLAQQRISRYLWELGREYDAQVFDASHWCNDADFADGQHLLADAAERLSVKLGQDALRGWLASSDSRPAAPSTVPGLAAGRRHEVR
ncbi:MAG TPA: hypothetical protein VNH11_14615 [Pirellulales bacterium]|nr:hypothetical protein [Pirellulales bacterium]